MNKDKQKFWEDLQKPAMHDRKCNTCFRGNGKDFIPHDCRVSMSKECIIDYQKYIEPRHWEWNGKLK